jgi:lipopolysaccharide export system protein LptA
MFCRYPPPAFYAKRLSRLLRWGQALTFILLIGHTPLIRAQTLPEEPPLVQNTPAPTSALPIEITAREKILWERDLRQFTAQGDALAVRGTLSIQAERLRAFYRDKKGGGSEIYRLEAEGGVVLRQRALSNPRKTGTKTPSAQNVIIREVTGESALYLLDDAIIEVRGNKPTLKIGADTVTASQTLRYDERQNIATATGRSQAQRQGTILDSDDLTAYLTSTSDGKLQLSRLVANGNVVITTLQGDIARAQKGVFDALTNRATLETNVALTRGQNQLNGARAEIDLTTGQSQILAMPGRERVRALVFPGAGAQ